MDSCSRCGSGDIHRWHIPAHDIYHCQCVTCEAEWVE